MKNIKFLKLTQITLLIFALMFFLGRDFPNYSRPFDIKYFAIVFIPLFFLSGALHELIRRKLSVKQFIFWSVLILIVSLLFLIVGYSLIYYFVAEEFVLRLNYSIHRTYVVLIFFLTGWIVSFLFQYFKVSVRIEKRK